MRCRGISGLLRPNVMEDFQESLGNFNGAGKVRGQSVDICLITRAPSIAPGPYFSFKNGGGSGIRTHDTVARIAVFKTAAFVRSAIPPC